jgi:transglutaminase-like putative cysteine protease
VTGLTEPKYLRKVGLQQWTPGKGWSIDQLTDGQLPNSPFTPAQQPVTVTALAYHDDFLLVYNGTTQVNGAGPGWFYDSGLQAVHRVESVTPPPYEIDAGTAAPTADQLRADTTRSGGLLTETGDLSADVVALATQVTAAATTSFDKADALRKYFTDPTNGFTYSLTVPQGTSGDLLVDFLTNKQGFCEQYASAMAIMLRAVGVPARVAIGFTQGTKEPDGSYLISSNDAHAWVEVLFDKSGWVQFDPTPLGGGQGGQQGFTGDAGAATSAQSVPSEEVPNPGLGVGEPTARGGEPTALTSQAPGGAGSNDNPAVAPGWWVALGILALVAAATAGPTLMRRRRRDRRLAEADAGGTGAAAAAWREVEDLAVDHGIGLNPAESARATANRLAKATHLSERGRAELRELVTAVERGWYASEPEPSRGSSGGVSTGTLVRPISAGPLGAAPRTIAAELQHHVPLALVDRLVPRSVRPSWWRD